MDAALNRKSLMLGIPGIVLQIAGNVMVRTTDPNNPDGVMLGGGVLLSLIGTVLLIIGLSWYAKAKGHSGWLGLLGLLSIIGIIVLAVLPDKRK